MRNLGPYEQFHGHLLNRIEIPEGHPGLVAAPYYDEEHGGFFWQDEHRNLHGPYLSVQTVIKDVMNHLNSWKPYDNQS